VGDGARKTNYDYTHGQLPELLDIIIDNGAKLFVSAVGVALFFCIHVSAAYSTLFMPGTPQMGCG
jgi:hypothetical protein